MTAAQQLIVFGGTYFVLAVAVGLLMEGTRPLPEKARTLRNIAATAGLIWFFGGLVAAQFGY